MRNLFLFIGLRSLQLRWGRTTLTTLGIALGIALYVGIGIINRSILTSFHTSMEAVSGKAELTVTAGELGFSEEKEKIIKETPGVGHAVPMIESRAYLAGKEKSSETIVILGVDLLKEQAVRTYQTTDEEVIEDPLVFLNTPDSLILTKRFAASHGLEIDSKIELATAFGSKTFTVRGLLTDSGPARAYGGALGLMDIDGARFTFAKEGKVDRIDIILAPGAILETVSSALSKKLGPGFFVERPETRSLGMARMIESYQAMLRFFSTLALLVGMFLVTNSVSMSVTERKKEIGTLRALGATRRAVLVLFLSEAAAMGLLGSAMGIMLGRALAVILSGLITSSMTSQFLTPIQIDALEFGPIAIATSLAMGTGAAFLAALWPSSRTLLISPLEAMKKSGIESEGEHRSLLQQYGPWIGGIFLVYASLSSIFKVWQSHPFLEVTENIAAMLGAALLGPKLVSWLLVSIYPMVRALGKTIPRIAHENLIRNPSRTGSNVLSLMVGLILVTIIASVNSSFSNSIQAWLDRILNADILVSAQGRIVSYQVQPIHEDIAREIEKIPGVEMGPKRGAYALRMVHFPYEGKQLAIKAFDDPSPESHYENFDLVDREAEQAGHELFTSQDPTVMVSKNFVLHYGHKTGDSLEVDTPTGRHKVRIIGVVQDFASAEGVLYFDREVYKSFWNDPLVSVFGVKVAEGHDPLVVRRAIDNRLGQSQNLMTVLNSEIKIQLKRVIQDSFQYTRVIELAALLVGLLGLVNTLLVSILERTRELGMLRAVGMSASQLKRMIKAEAITQGCLGALVAVGLGTWLAYLWVKYALAYALGWVVDYHFPWTGIWQTMVAGIAVALIAGIFPARRAAKMPITEALEYD